MVAGHAGTDPDRCQTRCGVAAVVGGDRPGHQHVIVTGRDADPRLTALADLVTEMGKVKHPMDVGRKGQRGIEW